MPRILLLCLLMLGLIFQIHAKTQKVQSPNGQLTLIVSDEAQLDYQLLFNGKPVLKASRLGLVFADDSALGAGSRILSANVSEYVDKWQQPWGERQWVENAYRQLVLTLSPTAAKKRHYRIRFRLFNDGLGFRYESLSSASENIAITDEVTEFVMADSEHIQAWWIPARGWNRYEYPYQHTPLHQLDRVHTPVTFKSANGVHISIHEAALVDFAAMTLDQRRSGTLKSELIPRSDGLKARVKGDFVTPWRTVQVAGKATGLLNSDLILNLNEPNKLGDVSWVKPGKYLGIWWDMHIGSKTWGSGDKHGATTEYSKKVMDFAAEHGFDGVLVEGWNIGWDGSWFHNGDVFSFTQSYPDFDLKAVTDYGAQKGVRLIGHHETSGSITNYEKQMQAAYKLYAQHGVSQIKSGYVADGGDIKRVDENGIVRFEWHDSQLMVNHYLKAITEAAKYKLSINTHEPIKDTGLRRTYPNWITREGARGQEFNAWGNPPNAPGHTVDLVYTRMLSGPMDFTPGIFDLMPNGADSSNRVQTTLAKQLALYVVLYSPIQMAADVITNYQANMSAFQFIKDVPTDWQQSIALDGEVGEYVVFARKARQGNDWYLGAITDENAREIAVPLDFLSPDTGYKAYIYADGAEADWQTNPYAMDIRQQNVSSKDTLIFKLATSGGVAIRFKALTRATGSRVPEQAKKREQ